MNPLNWFRRSSPQGTIPQGGSSIFMPMFSGGTRRRVSHAEQLDAYSGWVYAATSLIADDLAKVPYRVMTPRSKQEAERSELGKLLKNFVGMSPLEAKVLTQLHLDLTGEAFWLVVTSGGREGGRPIGLQVINPDWLEVETTRNGVSVAQWRLSVPGFNSRLVSGEDIIHFRLPNPQGDFRGFSPVRAFALAYDADLYARAYSADLLKNRATPEGIISSDQELTLDQMNTVKARWKEATKPGEINVMGVGMKYMPISSSLKDLEWLSLAQLNREAQLGIYRVPASKLGLDTSRSQADAGEADTTYEKNVLAPRVIRFDDTVNDQLAPRVGPERLQHDDPVAENREEKRKEALELWQNGLFTADQALEYLSWDAIGGSQGKVRMIPGKYRIVNKLEPTQATQATQTEENDEEDQPDS